MAPQQETPPVSQAKDDREPYGLFASHLAPDPRPTYRTPLIRAGNDALPEYVLEDVMGNEVVFKQGARVELSRFEGWNLSGLHLEGLVLDTVAFVACRLQNTEFVNCSISRVLVDGGIPGFVVKNSSVSEMCVTRADSGAVARWFNCAISGLIVTDNESISVEFTRVNGTHISLQRSTIVAPSRISASTIDNFRVVDTAFKDVVVANSNLFGAKLLNSTFTLTNWSDSSIECANLCEVRIDRSSFRNVRADGATIRQLKWTSSVAIGLTLSFASIVDWEAIGVRADIVAEHSSIDGFTWWKARLTILVNDTRIGSLRMCEGVLFMRGTESTLQSPVVRRSFVRSDTATTIRVSCPDVTSSQISSNAQWINPNGEQP